MPFKMTYRHLSSFYIPTHAYDDISSRIKVVYKRINFQGISFQGMILMSMLFNLCHSND